MKEKKPLIDRLKAIIYNVYIVARVNMIEFFRWREEVVMDKGYRVYYGHDHIPLPEERTSGGIVKCQDLQKEYPNTLKGANLLYLVSSALPQCPELLVKYAKRKGVKLIVNQNGVAFPAYHGNAIESLNGPRRFLLQQADYVIYQSEYCKMGADKYLDDNVKDYTILYNPVDVQFFTASRKQGVSKKPILLMTGSQAHFYRVASGVKTVAALMKAGVNVQLKIYGRLSWDNDAELCQKELIALCREHHVEDAVIIGEPYRQIDAPAIYGGADVFLHPKYNDACPRTVVEAMACGLPVVYSNCGGVPELVGENAGIGVGVPDDWENIHSPDPEEMAQAVIDILSSHEKFAVAARKRAEERFDVRPWQEKHREIFDYVLGNT